MPFYIYTCPEGHEQELLRGRECELVYCPCGKHARRAEVYPVNFTHGAKLGDTSLKTLNETAREMEYQVNRSDDPTLLKAGNRIAHAAKVRSEARMLAGATVYRPDTPWNAKEIE